MFNGGCSSSWVSQAGVVPHQSSRLKDILVHALRAFSLYRVASPARVCSIHDFITGANSPESGTELKFPTAIGCFGSFSKPDFAVRINDSQLKQYLKPVVMLGEAKKDIDTQSSSPVHRVAAQLAWSAHQTLTILIMVAIDAHTRLGEKQRWKNMVVYYQPSQTHRFTFPPRPRSAFPPRPLYTELLMTHWVLWSTASSRESRR